MPRQRSPHASQPPMILFFLPLPHVTGTPPQLLKHREGPPLALSSTPTLGGFFCFLIQSHVTYGRPLTLTLIPREAEDFPRGNKYFKHVAPPTYLIYLSPKDLYR